MSNGTQARSSLRKFGTTKTKLKNVLAGGLALLALPALMAAPAQAEPGFDHHRAIEVHRGFPGGYHHVVVPRDRFYRGIHVARFYGPRYPGFGFFYDDVAAFTFLGLTAWELSNYNELQEEQLRAHEAAMVEATSGPLQEQVTWDDGSASGAVTPIREGHTAAGQTCREFQQQVTVGGQTQQAYGTACQQPDGSWQIVTS